MAEDNSDRATMAMELAKRQLIDVMWKTANIEVDGITFPDTQEIFDGRAPADMTVNDIIVVNNIKRAWMFLFENGGILSTGSMCPNTIGFLVKDSYGMRER